MPLEIMGRRKLTDETEKMDEYDSEKIEGIGPRVRIEGTKCAARCVLSDNTIWARGTSSPLHPLAQP